MSTINSIEEFYFLNLEDQIKVRKYLNKHFLAYKLQVHNPRFSQYTQTSMIYKKIYPEQENISDKGIEEGISNLANKYHLDSNEMVILSALKIDVSPELFFKSIPENYTTIWVSLLD